MDGILVIDKPKNYTSRDVVNIIGKNFHTKKVGHTGTLDPLATGVLVVCVNKATKLVEILTSVDKVYIADFELGTLTDTLDTEGNILIDEKIKISKENIEESLSKMIGNYKQVVPIYSAVKVNGKKLYEYARNNEEVELPSHDVTIHDLELLDINYDNNKTNIKVRCHVSKGTYIRSLGNDIAALLGTNAIMTDLRRIKQGIFSIEDAIRIAEINENTKLISLNECLKDYYSVIAKDELFTYVKNGRSVKNVYNQEYVLFLNEDNEVLSLYKSDVNGELKPYKVFKID